jgi:hypothetical protein
MEVEDDPLLGQNAGAPELDTSLCGGEVTSKLTQHLGVLLQHSGYLL